MRRFVQTALALLTVTLGTPVSLAQPTPPVANETTNEEPPLPPSNEPTVESPDGKPPAGPGVGEPSVVPGMTPAATIVNAPVAAPQSLQAFACITRLENFTNKNFRAIAEKCSQYTDGSTVVPQTNRDLAKYTGVFLSQSVLVRLDRGDGTAVPSDELKAQLESVTVTVGEKSIVRTVSAGTIGNALVVPLKELGNVSHGSIATVRITWNGDRNPTEYFFSISNKVSPYGVAESNSGVWFPIALFGTNFKSTEKGIPFAAFPVGIAYGWRVQFSTQSPFYLGLSAMANWAIVNEKPEDDADNSNNLFLGGGALGGLLDISNYVYVGGAYTADFRKGYKDPGAVFVVGAAPGLLQLLKSRP